MNIARRINAEQRERLLDLVEKNKFVLFGNRTPGNDIKHQIWREIAYALNKLGSTKAVRQWRKTWIDIKSAVKKKASEIKAINVARGPDFPSEIQLSEEDYQVLRICDIHIMDGIAETTGGLSSLRKMNSKQRLTMLGFIEENLPILCGRNNKRKVEKWMAITLSLNTLGPKKSSEHWRRIWVDIKKAVKRKVAGISAAGDNEQLNEEDLLIKRIYEMEEVEYLQELEEQSEASIQSNDVRTDSNTIDSIKSVQSLPDTSQHHVEMENLQWLNHIDTIVNFQKSLKNDMQTCDVTVAFKGKSVKAHRFILSACSTLLRELLKDVPTGQDATIIVPDADGSLIDSVLNFIYIGETNITPTRLTEFLETIGSLGIKSPISFDCPSANISCKEPAEVAEIEQIEVEDEVKEEIIDVDDDEDITIVDPTRISQHDIIEDSLDDESFTSTEDCHYITPTHNDNDSNDVVDVLAEHLYIDSPMTKSYINNPIGQSKMNTRQPCIKKESSDDDFTDEISEPQTFRDKVNRLRAQQKKSLKNAILAYLQGDLSLQKAAIEYNVSRSVLIRQVTKHKMRMDSRPKKKRS